MRVLILTSLRSYTQVSRVEAVGTMLGEVMWDLDRQFPGIRFRMVDERKAGCGRTCASSSAAGPCMTWHCHCSTAATCISSRR